MSDLRRRVSLLERGAGMGVDFQEWLKTATDVELAAQALYFAAVLGDPEGTEAALFGYREAGLGAHPSPGQILEQLSDDELRTVARLFNEGEGGDGGGWRG